MEHSIDREKVLKGLECCLGVNDCDVDPKEDCPYKGMCLCAMALRFDVLTLLKEQEAIEPILDSFLHKRCPSCRTLLKGRFCYECGRAVKWE